MQSVSRQLQAASLYFDLRSVFNITRFYLLRVIINVASLTYEIKLQLFPYEVQNINLFDSFPSERIK